MKSEENFLMKFKFLDLRSEVALLELLSPTATVER
jgi:hypothetical protein